MDSNNSPSYHGINVTTNGVKRVVIPCKGYATTSSQNPFAFSSSPTIFVTALPSPASSQQATVTTTVSYLATSTVTGTRPAVFGTAPRPMSPLSGIRFPLASKYPNKTVLAVRPKLTVTTLPGGGNQNTATLACTPTQGTGLPIVRTTAVVSSVPTIQVIQAVPSRPGAISPRGKGISVITAARFIPNVPQPVFQSPLPNLGMTGLPTIRTIMPAKSVIRHLTPTYTQPPTAVVAPLKKTVTIRMPGSPNSIGASSIRTNQTKFALVEMIEGGKKVMKAIQLSNMDDVHPKNEVPEPAEEPEQAENPITDDLKVIEIVPDEGSEDDIPYQQKSYPTNEGWMNKEEPIHGPAISPPPGLLQAGTIQETVHSSPNSHGSRPGIFETLKSMTVEEASAAVAAVTMLHDDPNTVAEALASDPQYNIVHRGDDHLIIENPCYDDEGEDDSMTLSCDEESLLIIPEPNTRLNTPEPIPSIEAPRETSAVAVSSENRRSGLKGKNVAKRTGGRPNVALKNRAKRTGGRPMTNRERYGADIKECRVSLEKLYNTKSSVRWVHRHMLHILCCVNGQPGMRLKRLQRQKAAQLERPRDESSSEVSNGRKTRDKSRAGKAKTWGHRRS